MRSRLLYKQYSGLVSTNTVTLHIIYLGYVGYG